MGERVGSDEGELPRRVGSGNKILMGNRKTLDQHTAAFGGRNPEHDDVFPCTSPVGSFPTGA